MKSRQKIDEFTAEKLISAAREARENAYAPYSNFKVGAALLTESGKIFCGCNVENASYGLTTCAERNAVGNAILAGERRFKAIAIMMDDEPPSTPCGACRQVLAEFAQELHIISVNTAGHRLDFFLSDLIPHLFELK
ncbi:MAG: cytidine deaminase [Candidatus Sumerlaeia bacterium]|nr:cytidine deaminase [Candidatus Sumerlaeia bacterium]